MIKSRRMRWAGHEARMGDKSKYAKFLLKNQKEREHLGYINIDDEILKEQNL